VGGHPRSADGADAAGIALDVSLLELPTSEAAYREAIAKSLREGANAAMVGDNADALVNHSLILNLIGAVKVPALYPFWEFVDVGGLMAHSYDLMGLVKIIANDIDAILRGANPGDIPYHQSINLKTAKALGLTVPATLLVRADKVIE
jgi:putative ABC transport system substrate-binding protein